MTAQEHDGFVSSGCILPLRTCRRLAFVCVATADYDKDEIQATARPIEGLPAGAVPVGISAGDSHTAVLTADGEVYACGMFRVRCARV